MISIVREIRGTATSNIAIILISFGASVLAARLLGPDQRGTLAAAVVYVYLATAVADGGLNQAVPYFAARHRDDAPAVLGSAGALAMTFGGVAVIVASLILSLRPGTSAATLYYLPSVPFALVTTHLGAFMYGGGMLAQFNVVRVFQSALLLIALVVAAIAGRANALDVLVIAGALSVVLAVATVIILNRRIPFSRWRIDPRTAWALLRYAAQSYVGNLCWLFNSRLDQLMMTFLVPAASLGIYATSVSYAGVVFSFFSAFAMLAFAKASNVDAASDGQVRSIVRRHIAISLVVGIPVTIAIAGIAPWLYPTLFGPDFSPGVPATMILCVASVFLGLNYTLSNGLRIRNRPLLPSIAEGVGVVVSVAGLLHVLPRQGILGAAFVSLASYATVFIILIYCSQAGRRAAPGPLGSAL